MVSQHWSISFLALQYLQLTMSLFCFLSISSVVIYLLFMLFIPPALFLCPRSGLGWEEGAAEGCSRGQPWHFHFLPQTEVLTMPSSSQDIQNYLRHKEMELSKFWKEN